MTSFGRITAALLTLYLQKLAKLIFLCDFYHYEPRRKRSFKNLQGHILNHNQTFLYCRLSKIAKYIIFDDLL